MLFFLATCIMGSSSTTWLAERRQLVNNLRARYNASAGLLQGAHAGGHGFQWRGFSIIDENYLASLTFEAYNESFAGADFRPALAESLVRWQGRANYTNNDRRENLRGNPTCTSHGGDPCTEQGSVTITVAGTGDIEASPYAVYTEENNNNFFTADDLLAKGGAWVNHQVPLALALHARGDHPRASALFNHSLSLWDGVGFRDTPAEFFAAAELDGSEDLMALFTSDAPLNVAAYTTRGLGYFLYAQRALSGRPGYAAVAEKVVAAIEAQLWKLQACDSDGTGLSVAYGIDGTAICFREQGTPGLAPGFWGPGNSTMELSSIETAALALLPWDERIITAWWPR